MIVIGAGAAGLTVASGCTQLGLKTLLLGKENLLGEIASTQVSL